MLLLSRALSKIVAGLFFTLQMLGLLIIGLFFIIAPELAINLGMGMIKLKTAFEG